MGSEVVVDVAPVEVEDLGLEDGVEDLAVEELVAKPGIEALDERVGVSLRLQVVPRVRGDFASSIPSTR